MYIYIQSHIYRNLKLLSANSLVRQSDNTKLYTGTVHYTKIFLTKVNSNGLWASDGCLIIPYRKLQYVFMLFCIHTQVGT